MSHLTTETQLQVRSAFDNACIDVFHSRVRRELSPSSTHDLYPRFTQHYERLLALPRQARRSVQRKWKRTLAGVALLLALSPAASLAATMNVASGVAPDVNADGKCALIEAIFNANTNTALHPDCPAGSDTDTIILPVGSTQVLTNSVGRLPGSGTYYYDHGVPKIRSTIVIEGRRSTIERADGSPIDLMIAVETNGNLTLNETTISGRPTAASGGFNNNFVLPILNRGRLSLAKSSILRGNNPTSASSGGLRNEGTATLSNTTVANNAVQGGGGGINNRPGATLLVTDSVVSGNSQSNNHYAGAGGILNEGKATIRNSIIAGNRADGGSSGGIGSLGSLAIDNSAVSGNSGGIVSGGPLTINNSVISGNSGVSNGGILHFSGTATITRSTIADNVAYAFQDGFYDDRGHGGGISSANGAMTIVNSTISGNRAQGYGGGIWAESGTLTLTHTTVTSNRADLPDLWAEYHLTAIGGGVAVGSATVVRMERSLISGNQSRGTGPEVGIFPGTTPTIVANNFNLFGASGRSGVQGFTPGPTDIVPTVPITSIVLPRANNGGATPTHALAISSPALNSAPVDAECGTTDQRNNPRPQGVKCDIGSFEGSAVLCNGLVTTQVGTALADTLTGTAGRDVIAGLAGNDTIRGLDGNDVICAGSGADKVSGGNHNDLLIGDAGNDKLYGDAGNDALSGGTGDDACNGGSNTDTATHCETVTGVP